MAERWAVATGNWSNTATWNGGTLPGSGDTVHANTYTVTIDQDITVTEITTRAGTTPAAGGGFSCSSSRTLNCNVVAGSTSALTLGGTSWTITINGNVSAGPSVNARGVFHNTSGTCTLNINGNITGGSNTNAYGMLSQAGAITINVVGNILGGSASGCIGFLGSSTSELNVTGDVTAGTNSSATGITNSHTTTVTGNVTGNTAYGLEQTGTAKDVIINGNVTGGSSTTSAGVFYNTAGTLTVNGDLIGGSHASGWGVRLQAIGCTLIVNGDIVDNQTAEPLCVVASTHTIVTNGLFQFSTTGRDPITTFSGPEIVWRCGPNTVIRMEPSDLGDQVDFTQGGGGGGGLLLAGGFTGGIRRSF